ncbi:TonB-dependent receptor [Flavobacterium sp. JAS]|uniref:TonB-dependent receptor n=1 Tax=Flavobacterium sp. JAS TaxID=2897329 RepID=UPI001E47FA18|nr:TonB-dependent receptor [Flavobacterium sp. JAS]MCD0468726.1 TonB-dependent receptor [Flavobacterium sp. JAS]
MTGIYFLSIWFVSQTILKNKSIILLLPTLFLFFTAQTFSQVTISGTVKSKNGEPIEFASVFLKETASGSSTDSLGNFSFITSEKGSQIFSASYINFKTYQQPITIENTKITLYIILEVDQTTLEEVVVSAGTFEASDKAKGAKLNPIDVVTTAGNNGDIANALRTLPGTQQVAEQEGLFVRGGTSDETKQFIDGTLFKNPNFSSVPGIIQPARLSPFLFKGINFSTGGYSALYGEALSGALILESVDLPEQSSSIIGASPILGVAGFQQLSKNNKVSYGINSRYVNYFAYTRLITQKPDYFHGPEYISGDANFRMKIGKEGMLKFYSNYTLNNVGLRNTDIDSTNLKTSFQIKAKNSFNNLSFRTPLTNGWKINVGATYNFSNDNIINKLLNSSNQQIFIPRFPYNYKNNTIEVLSHFANGKIVLTKFFPHNQALRFGAEQFYLHDKFTYSDTTKNIVDNLTAVFAEGDIYLAKNIAAKIGMRYEYCSLFNKSSIAPRLSVAYRFNDQGQINFAYGLFYQKSDYRILFQNQIAPLSTAIFFEQYKKLDFTLATHYIINYTKKANNRLFRVEAYYKVYDKLVKTYPILNNDGTGYARGIELFFRDKKTFKDFDYWITYTFLDTKREFLNYPSSINPNFTTPHTVSIVTKRFFEKLNTSFNLAYSVATGRPYYNIRYENTSHQPKIFDRGTTDPYQSLNLSIAYLTSFFKKGKNRDFTVISASINNILGSNPVLGYNYSYTGNNKIPITLPATRTYFIGIFMSFGVNRTKDFINENL